MAHWKAERDSHKPWCVKVQKAHGPNAKGVAKMYLMEAVQHRMFRLKKKHFYVTRPGLAPSGECTLIEGAITGPVKVKVGLEDGTTKTLVLTANPGVRPVHAVFGNGESRLFRTQADCARWLHSLGKAHLQAINFSFRDFVVLYLESAHDKDLQLM